METLYKERTIKAECAFAKLQQRFTKHFREIFLNDLAEKTVVIIPSLTLDSEMLKTVKGVIHMKNGCCACLCYYVCHEPRLFIRLFLYDSQSF